MLADGVPALATLGAVLDQVDPIPPLAAQAEALDLGVPDQLTGGQRIDDGLGDFAALGQAMGGC